MGLYIKRVKQHLKANYLMYNSKLDEETFIGNKTEYMK